MTLSYDVTSTHRGGPQAIILSVSTNLVFWTIYRFGRYTVSTQRLVWAWDYRQIDALCQFYTAVYDAWGSM